jgi:hypothetical protein
MLGIGIGGGTYASTPESWGGGIGAMQPLVVIAASTTAEPSVEAKTGVRGFGV